MIAASKSGLPVNIEKVPSPPQVRSSAKLLKPSVEQHFDATIKDASAEIFATMEKDLIYQVKFCEENMRAFTQLSDVSRVKLFEAWSAISKRDLILLRELAKRDAAVPQFRYETRSIPSVEVCLDVDKHNIELTIIKITDAKLPAGWKSSDGYLFVKFDFAFPHDAHQTGRTKVIAATNSPEYNQKFLLTISRKTKQLLRVIKRNCLKFEIYQKGGFLRSDKLIATADCKLSGLEEKVYIRESLNLMEGRKQAGGKLNYQVRIREPLNGKMLSVTQKKWLMLGS
uniref:C2 domain-containing protein n=1 Tax=Setaria digitata TaxID=48799 RepID=A0A915Q632_9BILA